MILFLVLLCDLGPFVGFHPLPCDLCPQVIILAWLCWNYLLGSQLWGYKQRIKTSGGESAETVGARVTKTHKPSAPLKTFLRTRKRWGEGEHEVWHISRTISKWKEGGSIFSSDTHESLSSKGTLWEGLCHCPIIYGCKILSKGNIYYSLYNPQS